MLEASLLAQTSEQKIDFYKKMYELDDIDFISIYPLLDHWEDEAEIIIDEKCEELDEKYSELCDRKDALINQFEERLELTGYYD